MHAPTLKRILRQSARVALGAWVGLALAGAAPAGSAAPAITVRMATLAPEGSSWDLILKEVADKWNKISKGRVRLIIYPSGTQGDDPDVVRKIRLGALQAGVLTSEGLAEIDRGVFGVGIPLAYSDYDEVYYVLEKLRPRLEAAMEAKGFVVLNWMDGGWLRFFTQKPVVTPEDLKPLRMFSWAGDNWAIETWRSAGFTPVPLASTELPAALQTGLVQAVAVSPQIAVITRYFETARYMTDLGWAMLLGGTVISKDTWERIPADIRPALYQAARDAGERLQAEVRKSGEQDIESMRKRGLHVVTVDAKARESWQRLAESLYGKVRGGLVPPDVFDEAMRYRDEYRASHPVPRGAEAR